MIRITFFFLKQMQQEEKGGKTRGKKKEEGRARRGDKEMGMLPLVTMEAAHLTTLCVLEVPHCLGIKEMGYL
jgi:hypothetical protein